MTISAEKLPFYRDSDYLGIRTYGRKLELEHDVCPYTQTERPLPFWSNDTVHFIIMGWSPAPETRFGRSDNPHSRRSD